MSSFQDKEQEEKEEMEAAKRRSSSTGTQVMFLYEDRIRGIPVLAPGCDTARDSK